MARQDPGPDPTSVVKNVGSTWILNALQIVSVLVLSPWIIQRLDVGPNGLWVTIVSLTGLLQLLILGVPMASVRFLADAVARRDEARVRSATSTCFAICLALGAGALFVGLGLWWLFDTRYLGGTLAQGLAPETLQGARIACGVVVAQVALGFVLRLPYGVLDAHHDFVVRNAIMAGEIALRFTLTLGLLAWSPTLPALATVQIVCLLAEGAAALLVVRARHPAVRFSLAAFDRGLVREVLGFSVYAMLLNVGVLLSFRLDAVVIGAFLPAEQATLFDVGNKFFDPLTGLLIAVGAVVMPLAAKLQVTGQAGELRGVFLKWSKICLSLVLAIGLYLLVLGPPFLGAWIGPRFEGPSGQVLQVLMLSFLVWLPVRGVALPILLGLGKPRAPALALLGMGIVNLALSLALVRPLGILGVALGTAIPNVVFALYVLRLACRELGVPLREWAGYVCGRALPGALVPLAFLLAVRAGLVPREFPALIASGAAMLVVFALTWFFFVYRDDPHVDVRGWLARVRLNGSGGGAR